MARVGISEQQVFEAAEALLTEGQGVTVSSVRERLGSGSFTTINAHLGKWREVNDKRKPADIPEIPQSVDNALRHVWALAWKEAQERIKTEREGLDAARREMEREKKDLEGEIVRLETQIDAQGDEIKKSGLLLADKNTALSEAENAKQTLLLENVRLEERVKAAEERAGEFHRELDRLHARLRELAATKAKPPTRGGGRKKPGSEEKT